MGSRYVGLSSRSFCLSLLSPRLMNICQHMTKPCTYLALCVHDTLCISIRTNSYSHSNLVPHVGFLDTNTDPFASICMNIQSTS